MRALPLVWTFVALLGCRGSSEPSTPAADKAAPRPQRLQVVYDLDLDKAVDDKATLIRRDLEVWFTDQKIMATVRTSPASPGELVVTTVDAARRAAIQQQLKADYGDVLEIRDCGPAESAAAVCARVTASYAVALKKVALAEAVKTIRTRLDAAKVAEPSVVAKGDQIVVEFPATDEKGLALRSLVARAGKLEFKIVDDASGFMQRLYTTVGSVMPDGNARDPRALEAGIRAEVDQWRSEDTGNIRIDYYLVAPDRDEVLAVEAARKVGCRTDTVDNGRVRCRVTGRMVIERYIAGLATGDGWGYFKVPDDRELAYEPFEPGPAAKNRSPHWRTYYLERKTELTGAAIANAVGAYDPNTNRPVVLLDFTRAGGQALGELTERIVDKKLATVLDGVVKSAPIINGPIRGGRASITMGGTDAQTQERERDELVNVLKSGSLPAPLRELSAKLVP